MKLGHIIFSFVTSWLFLNCSLDHVALAKQNSRTGKGQLWNRLFGRSKGSLSTTTISNNKKKWSAMFTVDPSAILTTLIKAGGIFIPKSSREDLKLLRECLHCEHAEMNVVEKTMILYNWTIGLAGEDAALSVGRAYVQWDSYTRPTVFIEVDDVTLLVEFRNLVLTKSNWQALASRGFPPDIVVSQTKVPEKGKKEAETSSYLVRFGSIDLSGKARVCMRSKPLKKDMGTWELDMNSFDEFTSLMQGNSERQLLETGRAGLTSTEVATLLQQFFTKKIRAYLYAHSGNMTEETRHALQHAKGFMHKAADSVLGYTADASKQKGHEWHEEVVARLCRFNNTRLNTLLGKLPKPNATTTAPQ
jgi:hypothetical protein